MPRNKTGDQNSSARLVAVSESGNHLVSFSNSIVFTTSFALTDHYGKPNFTKKTGPKIEPGSRAGVWSRTIVRMTARPSVPLPPPEQRSSGAIAGQNDSNTLEHAQTVLSVCNYRMFNRLGQINAALIFDVQQNCIGVFSTTKVGAKNRYLSLRLVGSWKKAARVSQQMCSTFASSTVMSTSIFVRTKSSHLRTAAGSLKSGRGETLFRNF
jgi:hypothetical protein